MSDPYESDFHDWAHLQAKLLREGRVTEADLDHIAEEIEDLGNRRNELRSRLAVLLAHLLKWEHQTGFRSRSWQSTIAEQRDRFAEHLEEHPSLKPLLPQAIVPGYRHALHRVGRGTGLSRTLFPASCPYASNQILDLGFFPGTP